MLLGGDADTQACIAGAVAEAYGSGLPPEIEKEVMNRLPDDLGKVVRRFQSALPR